VHQAIESKKNGRINFRARNGRMGWLLATTAWNFFPFKEHAAPLINWMLIRFSLPKR
jgi:hypothetical protein